MSEVMDVLNVVKEYGVIAVIAVFMIYRDYLREADRNKEMKAERAYSKELVSLLMLITERYDSTCKATTVAINANIVATKGIIKFLKRHIADLDSDDIESGELMPTPQLVHDPLTLKPLMEQLTKGKKDD
jgi:hypothetical protein